MAEPLQGQVALITGGATEVAGAVAFALAQAGALPCLCGTQMDLLELSAGKIRAAGRTCLAVETGLGSLDAAELVVSQVLQTFGRLDILILVSPFWAGGPIHAHNVRTWDLVLEANLRGPFLMTRAALPHFREHKRGEIMTIGSDSALETYRHDGAYGVAMHALTALLELIRVENAEFGIRTHSLAPGVTLTQETDAEGAPALTAAHVADWAIWLLTRPGHLRGNGPVRVSV